MSQRSLQVTLGSLGASDGSSESLASWRMALELRRWSSCGWEPSAAVAAGAAHFGIFSFKFSKNVALIWVIWFLLQDLQVIHYTTAEPKAWRWKAQAGLGKLRSSVLRSCEDLDSWSTILVGCLKRTNMMYMIIVYLLFFDLTASPERVRVKHFVDGYPSNLLAFQWASAKWIMMSLHKQYSYFSRDLTHGGSWNCTRRVWHSNPYLLVNMPLSHRHALKNNV